MVRQKDIYDYAAEGVGTIGGGLTGFVAPGAIRNRMIRGKIASEQESRFKDTYTSPGTKKGSPRYISSKATTPLTLPKDFSSWTPRQQTTYKNAILKRWGVPKDGGAIRDNQLLFAGKRLQKQVDKFDDSKVIKPIGAGKAVRRTKNGVNSYEFEYDPRAYRAQARANVRRGQKSALDMGLADVGAVKNRAMGIYKAGREKGIGAAWDVFAGNTLKRANQANKWFGHGSKTNILGRGIMTGGKPLARLAVTPLTAYLGNKLSGQGARAVRDFYS